ncbi:MAG TPA: ATP-binding protein [Candidatus Dormibacteraeota bacterium]|nr:ATP-binding protein [Candidatus Dormibacteraeota bacterium]
MPPLRRPLVFALAVAIPLAAVTVFVALGPRSAMTDVTGDVGRAGSALAALVACGVLARRSAGRLRRSWSLLATSALIATIAEGAEAAYTAWSGATPGFLAVSDVGTVWAMPAAIAALLLFPRQQGQPGIARRAALDAAMIALSLIFIGSALALPQLFIGVTSPGSSWIGLASLAIDFSLLTVVSLTLHRVEARQRPRILFVLAGLAMIAIADCASVLLYATGSFTTLRELLASAPMYGFALVAVAPLRAESDMTSPAEDMPLWPDLIPYGGVAAVAVTAVAISMAHQPMTAYAATAAGGMAAVLLASHLLTRSEARSMLRQRRIAEEKARQRETMLNDLIDHAPQGVAAIGADHRITDVNPRLASMLVAPAPVLVGSTMDSFLPADYLSRVFKGVQASGETYEAECQARRADGSPFWIHLSVTAIPKSGGSVAYFLATLEDVTAKREAEETAVANLAQLEKLNRLKSEFVSMVSHEFRTALVGIQGFSELIHDQDLDPKEVKSLAEEINNDAQRLNRMITEMLDFDRLEAGKMRLDLRPLDLNELVSEAVDRAAVTTQKHMIAAQLQPGLPAVLGDADRLTQVLTNLLSNAIKYSPNGGEVCVRTRAISGAAEVCVSDHGRGIPPEFISRLFGRYERYEDKHAGKIIGTGLGLAITRQIVEMHGGRITVDSEVGKGSEFRFTVPLASAVASLTTRSG